MKISCTPISCSGSFREGMSQEEYFRLIAANGAEASDIMEPEGYPWFWRDFDREKRDIVRRMKDCGLALSGYAAGNNFAVADPECFARQTALVKKAVHEAAEFGAPCLRIFGGYHEACGGEKGMTMSRGLECVERGLEAVLHEAEKCGVVLALENHGRIPGLADELLWFCRRFDSPFLRVLFDCANFMANNMDESEHPCCAFEKLKSYVVHCHVKSFMPAPPETGRRMVGCVAGEGHIVPLRQFFYTLAQNGYGKYCSLEYEGGAYTPEAEGVPRSLRNLAEMKQAAEKLFKEKI